MLENCCLLTTSNKLYNFYKRIMTNITYDLILIAKFLIKYYQNGEQNFFLIIFKSRQNKNNKRTDRADSQLNKVNKWQCKVIKNTLLPIYLLCNSIICYNYNSNDCIKYIQNLIPLFLFSNYNFLPSLLLALFVKNLSFFHALEVCWKSETGSFFFFWFAGVFNLKVYNAESGLLLPLGDEISEILASPFVLWSDLISLGLSWYSSIYSTSKFC
jgi:hypothetical protein